MFNNIPEMVNYLNSLKKSADEQIELKKNKLNNICEACKKNTIEIVYKDDKYVEDFFDEDGHKMRLNVHFFCEKCYKYIIETGQLSKSGLMKDIDDKIFGKFDNESTI